jgi:hypothetical protein
MKKFSYVVILQKGPVDQETDLFDVYRSTIPARIQEGAVAFQQIKTDAIQKNGSILRGGLSHFLSTPLKSDKDEIIKLIEDSIENTVLQLDAAPMLSTVGHSLWRVMEPQEVPLQRQMVGVVKRLLKNGRSMLVNAGCTFAKKSGDVAISLFEFDGFSTVQSLRSIVGGFGSEGSLNIVNGAFLTTVTSTGQDVPADNNIVIIDFDDPDGSLTAQLNETFPVLLGQFGIQNITLSKQSLHSSVGSYVQLRIGIDVNKHPLGSVLVSMIGDHDELENAITNHGSVTVLERLP